MKITPFFRWYDLWVGIFVDTKSHTVYICPVPMLGIKVQWRSVVAAAPGAGEAHHDA